MNAGGFEDFLPGGRGFHKALRRQEEPNARRSIGQEFTCSYKGCIEKGRWLWLRSV